MPQNYSELAIGDVLIAPFVFYAGLALLIQVSLRPILRRLRIERLFSNPPIVQLSLYVLILATLFVFA